MVSVLTSRMRSTVILVSILSAAACTDESPVAPARQVRTNANVGTTATCEVTSVADNGVGTLRAHAADPACATITFASALNGQTITLAPPVIVLNRAVSIIGPGADKLKLTLVAGALTHVFDVGPAGDAKISGLTVADIVFPDVSGAPAAGSCDGDLESRFMPTAICSQGKLALSDVRVARITGLGNVVSSGIYTRGTRLEIKRSELEQIEMEIAPVYVSDGALIIEGSTFVNNKATSAGAVLFGSVVEGTIQNSTFTGNISANWPAVVSYGMKPLHLRYNTISGNSGGMSGGVENLGFDTAPITLEGNVIAGNTVLPLWAAQGYGDLSHATYWGNGLAYVSRGHNVIGLAPAFAEAAAQPTDLLGVTNPQLGPLAYNGGLTRTMALLATSPAVNAVPLGASSCGGEISIDQRGVARPKGGKCDAGAFESDFSPITFSGFSSPVSGTALNVVNAGRIVPLKWRLTNADGSPVTNLTTASITVASLACPSGGTVSTVTETGATNASGLQNLGDGYYQLNWLTQKGWAGTCRRVQVNIAGLQPQMADFHLR